MLCLVLSCVVVWDVWEWARKFLARLSELALVHPAPVMTAPSQDSLVSQEFVVILESPLASFRVVKEVVWCLRSVRVS